VQRSFAGVGVAVGVGVDPAWATADQPVTPSAIITRGPTRERRVVAFNMALLPMCKALIGEPPHIGTISPEIDPIGSIFGGDVKFFSKSLLVTDM